MQYIDTLVDSKDYELNTVGPKAYKLKIMENLVDKGSFRGCTNSSLFCCNSWIY